MQPLQYEKDSFFSNASTLQSPPKWGEVRVIRKHHKVIQPDIAKEVSAEEVLEKKKRVEPVSNPYPRRPKNITIVNRSSQTLTSTHGKGIHHYSLCIKFVACNCKLIFLTYYLTSPKSINFQC